MQTIKELGDENILEKLTSCLTTDGVKHGSNNALIKQIKGFQVFFKKLMKTPAMVRMLLHHEFLFDGQIDFTRHTKFNRLQTETYTYLGTDLLQLEWYPRSFVVPDYGNMDNWAAKMRQEKEAGKLVVAVLPARTNTSWFHEHVIPHAEVRFLKGRLTFPGYKAQTPFPDIIVIFRPEKADEDDEMETGTINLNDEKSTKVAILSSFTGDAAVIAEVVDQDEAYNDEDEDE